MGAEKQKDLFDRTIKDFLDLMILNNINENLLIKNIPFKDIIIEVIRDIINKSKDNKKDRKQEIINKKKIN